MLKPLQTKPGHCAGLFHARLDVASKPAEAIANAYNPFLKIRFSIDSWAPQKRTHMQIARFNSSLPLSTQIIQSKTSGAGT